jgi:hypothetical protein
MPPSPQIILENLKLRFAQRFSNNLQESAHSAFFHGIDHAISDYASATIPAEIETAAYKAPAPA